MNSTAGEELGPDSHQVTTLLLDWRQGNAGAGDQFIAIVYNELRRLAAHCLDAERRDHTLQPTALVHELYLRLFASGDPITWQNRAHFFAVAAQTLRRILVDHARAHRAQKRGGAQVKLSLTAAQGWLDDRNEDLLALDEALRRLEHLQPRAGQVVELRFFGGLQEDEIAEVLAIAPITVKRDWKFARAWLMSQLLPSDSAEK
jgi:RNA polymerase sigma factor (TIGR02999 family)